MLLSNLKWMLIGLVVLIGLGVGAWLAWPTLSPSPAIPSQATDSASPSNRTEADAAPSDDPIACGPTMYSHDFEDPDGGWYDGAGENAEWRYADDGTYRIATSIASNVVPSWAPLDTSYLPEGFCLGVRVQASNPESVEVADGSRAAAVGLIFAGSADKSRFHTFGVAPASGVFRVRKRDFKESVSSNVIEWTSAGSMKGGAEWNEIEIRVRGNRAQFYVNGQRVQSAEIDGSGTLGLFLESFDDADVNGRFDDFELREVEPSAAEGP